MDNPASNGSSYEKILRTELMAYGLGSDYKLTETRNGNRLQHRITVIAPGFKFLWWVLSWKTESVGEITVEPRLSGVKEKPGLTYGPALEYRVIDNRFTEKISGAISRVVGQLEKLG